MILEHRFTLKKHDGKWLIFEDEILNGPQPEISDFKLKLDISGELEVPYSTESSFEAKKLLNAPFGGYVMYDRTRTVNYAKRWANSFNPVYRKFDLDCTNFISQCVKAGGWPDAGWGNPVSRSSLFEWWYAGLYQTYTWVNANDWFAFTYMRPRGVTIQSSMNLKIGDVVQIDFNQNGIKDHSMIVTRKEGLNIYVSAHTYPLLDEPLFAIWAKYPNAKWYYWSLFDAVQ